MVSRRAVLAAGAVTLGGVAACTADSAEPAPAAAPTFGPKDWGSVRAQFTVDYAKSQYAAFVLAPHPVTVRAAVDKHRTALDADPYGYLAANEAALDRAAADAAGSYLKTPPGQIAFTDSTTMGLGLLYTGLRLAAGDEVLTTEHDFYSTHEALELRARRDGVTVKRVRLYDDPATADAATIVRRLTAAVTPKTRLIAITWVHSSTGVKLPVRQISDALGPNRPLLCVDGVHGFAAVAATPADLGCDFLVSGTHKWLFGPRGTGLIWGSPAGWARYTAVIPSFHALGGPDVSPGAAATPGGYHSFEHRWALAEAFAFHQSIGPARVAARTGELATALKAGLAGLAHVRIVTPASPDLSAGLICCEVEGYRPREAVSRLASAGVLASATPYDPSYLRFGTSILTDERDVDRAVAAVRALG